MATSHPPLGDRSRELAIRTTWPLHRAPAIGVSSTFDPRVELGLLGLLGALAVGVAASREALLGLAVLAAVALTVAMLHHPRAAALLLVAVAPASSGLSRGLVVPGFRLSELVIVWAATIVLLAAGRRRLPWMLVDWAALAYVAATALIGFADLLARAELPDGDARGALIGPLQFFLLYRAVLCVAHDTRVRRAAVAALLLAAVPTSVFAILQHLHLFGAYSYAASITDPRDSEFQFNQLSDRPIGLFPHWQVLGGYLVCICTVGSAMAIHHIWVLPRRVLLGVLVLTWAALLATATATTLLATLIATLIVAVWAQRGTRVLVLLAIGLALAAPVYATVFKERYDAQTEQSIISDRPSWVPQTLAFRYEIWRDQYIPATAQYVLTGYGPSLPPEVDFKFPESLYIALMLRGGLPLLLIYGAMMVAMFVAANAIRKRGDPDSRALGGALTALLIVLVPMHVVEPYFVTTGLPHVLWVLLALALGAARDPSPMSRAGLAETAR